MNPLQAVGEELRQHRQAKQISLHQVSAATRIHLKFLEAIESGTLSALPEPYIRAFLREFAQTIGLDPQEILRQYDEAVQKSRPAPAPSSAAPSSSTDTLRQQALPGLTGDRLRQIINNNRRYTYLIIALPAVAVVLFLLSNGKATDRMQVPQEVTFDRAVRESEAALVKNTVSPPPASAVRSDSLLLEIHTTDSLWLMIVIDGNRSVEYLFPPNYQRAWLARERFQITLGNAGGATFRLNGKELGVLGKRGAVVRNAEVTARSLANM